MKKLTIILMFVSFGATAQPGDPAGDPDQPQPIISFFANIKNYVIQNIDVWIPNNTKKKKKRWPFQ